MKAEFVKIVEHFKEVLKCEQFVLTGSCAMSYMGLVEESTVKDIDFLLVSPSEEAKAILVSLQTACPATIPAKYPESENLYRFQFKGVDVDVFVENHPIATNIQTTEGILISPLPRLITAKKNMNRLKDWLQLRRLSKKFFQQYQFDQFLDGQEMKWTSPSPDQAREEFINDIAKLVP